MVERRLDLLGGALVPARSPQRQAVGVEDRALLGEFLARLLRDTQGALQIAVPVESVEQLERLLDGREARQISRLALLRHDGHPWPSQRRGTKAAGS